MPPSPSVAALSFVMLVHWIGCLMHAVPSLEAELRGNSFDDVLSGAQPSWLGRADLLDAPTYSRYIASIYWAVVTCKQVFSLHPASLRALSRIWSMQRLPWVTEILYRYEKLYSYHKTFKRHQARISAGYGHGENLLRDCYGNWNDCVFHDFRQVWAGFFSIVCS